MEYSLGFWVEGGGGRDNVGEREGDVGRKKVSRG